MEQLRSNQPNAGRLVSSLRSTGYDSYAAIEDIIDNSLDARARTIRVSVEHQNKKLRITVADDGIGMDEAVLDEALKLGSLTEKDEVSDLGKFGMGLCTASISLARKVEVITKQSDENALYSAQDLDEIIERNEFVKSLRPASRQEGSLLLSTPKGSGTLIILSKIDNLSDTNVSQFAQKLSRDMGRIYRKFIEAGVEFYVNDKRVGADDPLMLEHPDTIIYSDEEYELPIISGENGKESIRVRMVILPEVNEELEKEYKMNIRNQGFYVLRNNREVAAGETLDIFNKHNDFNRLRIELSFGASLDSKMGVRFTKDGIQPNQAITDFLKQEIGGQIASVRRSLEKKRKASDASMVDHTSSEKVIAKKVKLLITPDAEIEKRSKRGEGASRKPSDSSGSKDRKDFRETQTSPKGLGARFEGSAMGASGTLFEPYQEGRITVIRWNTDHPFYDRVVLANKGSKNIISALDYLIYALASAELKSVNDENVELLINLRSIMSTNLRALLS